MALIAGNMPPENPEEDAQDTGPETPQEDTQEINPQMKQQYEKLFMAATRAIHTPQISDALIKVVQQSPDPAKGLAAAALMMFGQLFKQSNGTMPPDMAVHLIPVLVAMIAELLDKSKAVQVTPQMIQQASAIAMQQAKGLMQNMGQGQPQPQGQPPGQPPGAQPQGMGMAQPMMGG